MIQGVCNTVQYLCGVLVQHTQDEALLESLATVSWMPVWAERKRLDIWEELVIQTPPCEDPSNTVEFLLDEVIEFGRFNLYGGFMPGAVREELDILLGLFFNRGIPVAETFEVKHW